MQHEKEQIAPSDLGGTEVLGSWSDLRRFLRDSSGAALLLVGSAVCAEKDRQLAVIHRCERKARSHPTSAYADLSTIPEIREELGVIGVPTTLVIMDGIVIERLAGLQDEARILECLTVNEGRIE